MDIGQTDQDVGNDSDSPFVWVGLRGCVCVLLVALETEPSGKVCQRQTFGKLTVLLTVVGHHWELEMFKGIRGQRSRLVTFTKHVDVNN